MKTLDFANYWSDDIEDQYEDPDFDVDPDFDAIPDDILTWAVRNGSTPYLAQS
jgi:ankyrin repeat protein